MGRNGEMPELANLAVFLMSDGAIISPARRSPSTARCICAGGNFAAMSHSATTIGRTIRDEIRGANEKTKRSGRCEASAGALS